MLLILLAMTQTIQTTTQQSNSLVICCMHMGFHIFVSVCITEMGEAFLPLQVIRNIFRFFFFVIFHDMFICLSICVLMWVSMDMDWIHM